MNFHLIYSREEEDLHPESCRAYYFPWPHGSCPSPSSNPQPVTSATTITTTYSSCPTSTNHPDLSNSVQVEESQTSEQRDLFNTTTTTTRWRSVSKRLGSLASEHQAGSGKVQLQQHESRKSCMWTEKEGDKTIYYIVHYRRRRRRYVRVRDPATPNKSLKPINTTSFKKSSPKIKTPSTTKQDTTPKKID